MKTIIDGYNLLMTCGFVSPNRIGPGALQRARQMMIGILKQKLATDEQPQTLVVFDSSEQQVDASDADQPALPIQVVFATEFDDADSMIEILIQRHSAPKTLTVVSSDHRIQNAASRRKAIAIDSDEWFFDRIGIPKNVDPELRKKTMVELLKSNELEISEEDSLAWTDLFSQPSQPERPTGRQSEPLPEDSPPENPDPEVWNPFPDDYADDLFSDE